MRPKALDVMWMMALRTWAKTIRRPVLLTFSFVQPLMWMTFFGFVFHRYDVVSELGGEGRYLDFLAPGVAVMTVLFGASQSGIGFVRDWQTGMLSRFASTPAPSAALLAGKLGADVIRLMIQACVVLLLACALGASLDVNWETVPRGLVAVFAFAVAFSSLSCAIALLTKAQESMAVFVHVINMPLLFTSTVLVPQKDLPDWLARVASLNPLSLVAESSRGTLLGTEPESRPLALSGVVLLAGVLFFLSSRLLARGGEAPLIPIGRKKRR